MADQIPRISAEEAHAHLASNPEAMLVCAYDDYQKFEQNHLEGAIPLHDLNAQAYSIPKDREIIFYCA